MTGRFVVIFRFATGRKTQVEGARCSDGRRRGNPPNCFTRVAQDLTDFNSWLERFERDAPDSMSAWTEAVRACHELECIAVFWCSFGPRPATKSSCVSCGIPFSRCTREGASSCPCGCRLAWRRPKSSVSCCPQGIILKAGASDSRMGRANSSRIFMISSFLDFASLEHCFCHRMCCCFLRGPRRPDVPGCLRTHVPGKSFPFRALGRSPHRRGTRPRHGNPKDMRSKLACHLLELWVADASQPDCGPGPGVRNIVNNRKDCRPPTIADHRSTSVFPRSDCDAVSVVRESSLRDIVGRSAAHCFSIVLHGRQGPWEFCGSRVCGQPPQDRCAAQKPRVDEALVAIEEIRGATRHP